MKCFFHSSDLDGHCSGAIVKYFLPECKLIPINYGKDSEFCEDMCEDGEEIWLVDFTLQPFERMIALNKRCKLVWIDHHETEIREAQRNAHIMIRGIQEVGIGACALVWKFISGEEVPLVVKLLAEYDVWKHDDSRVLPFQYGLRQYVTFPVNGISLWKDLFKNENGLLIKAITLKGTTILAYEERQNEKYCESYAFETEFEEYRAIAINKGLANSKIFDSVDMSKYDIMIRFVRAKGHWNVGLNTESDSIHVGELAKKYNGGGHQKAAGFQCKELPFDY